MNSAELEKFLRKRGATIHPNEGKGGHITVRYKGRETIMPRHGSRKELGKGLVNKILKALGLK
ncbi:MAG: type II toxin-antitoxin system HicA family toxin [Rhodospirillales bacterium]